MPTSTETVTACLPACLPARPGHEGITTESICESALISKYCLTTFEEQPLKASKGQRFTLVGTLYYKLTHRRSDTYRVIAEAPGIA